MYPGVYPHCSRAAESPSAHPTDIPSFFPAGSSEFSILTLVARENGFFANHGLNVTFTAYPSGIEAMDMLLANKADIAYAAEFVGVTYLLRSYDIRTLGTVAKSEVISLVTRNDRNNRRHSEFWTAGRF